MVTAQRGQGQYMSIQSGPNGCMANTRQIMRILAYLLELRPEHNKPNRDSYIAINPSALNNGTWAQSFFGTLWFFPRKSLHYVFAEVASIGLFNVIPDSTIIYSPSEFDYNSITLMDTNSYSSNGAPVVASKTARQIWNNGTGWFESIGTILHVRHFAAIDALLRCIKCVFWHPRPWPIFTNQSKND